MPSSRVSQRDVARRANVHFTTVSLALRDSPNLPETTRLRIQALAREMGYRPDPMLSALQSYRKNMRSPGFQGVIAWINCHTTPANLYRGKYTVLYLSAARRRCEELGYQLEEFNLANTTTQQLSKIFRARNIQGLLLPPQPDTDFHFNFDWENYSAITFGYTLREPRLHLVTNAQYSSARMAVHIVRERYDRIGFVSTEITDERTDRNFSAGYLAEQRQVKQGDQIPMLILKDEDASRQEVLFWRWYKKYRPSAILAHYEAIGRFLETAGISYSECGLALLFLTSCDQSKYAGIYQNDLIIGSTAVDFVVGMIQRNERGIPGTPLRILVEGKWVEGDTLPFRRPEALPGHRNALSLSSEVARSV